MPRMTFRGHGVDVDLDPAGLASGHPRLARVRDALIADTGDVRLVDQYLSHRLAAAFGKFGHDYLGDMSARIDRIFDLRDELAGAVDATLRGEAVHIDALQSKFRQLAEEMNQLIPPIDAAKKMAALDAPRDLPAQTRPADAPTPPLRAGGGGGGIIHPPDHLTALAKNDNTRDGLQVIESQTAAPGLRAQLAAAAQTHGDLVATLLGKIGLLLSPQHAAELRGISHFLEAGGNPSALVRLLSVTEQFGGSTPLTKDWTGDIRTALRMMGEFSPEAARGLGVVFASGDHTGAVALRIIHNFQHAPQIAIGFFESLARLQSRSRGLDKVVAFFASRANPEDMKAAQGQLLTANQMLDRYPDATLEFEAAIGGRVIDLVIIRAGGILEIHAEVKFHTTFRSVDADTRLQLAKDMVRDAETRQLLERFQGIIEPPFATILWRFERGNLAAALAKTLGREPTPAELAAAIRKKLKAVFKENEAMLRQALGAEFDAYRTAFESSAFLEVY
jgi:hypothetical protein